MAFFIVAQNENKIIKLENSKKRRFNNIKIIKSGYEIKNIDDYIKNHIIWVVRADKLKRSEFFLKLP